MDWLRAFLYEFHRARQIQRLANGVAMVWTIGGYFAEMEPETRFHVAGVWAAAFRTAYELHQDRPLAERAAALAVQAVVGTGDELLSLDGRPTWASILVVS